MPTHCISTDYHVLVRLSIDVNDWETAKWKYNLNVTPGVGWKFATCRTRTNELEILTLVYMADRLNRRSSDQVIRAKPGQLVFYLWLWNADGSPSSVWRGIASWLEAFVHWYGGLFVIVTSSVRGLLHIASSPSHTRLYYYHFFWRTKKGGAYPRQASFRHGINHSQ